MSVSGSWAGKVIGLGVDGRLLAPNFEAVPKSSSKRSRGDGRSITSRTKYLFLFQLIIQTFQFFEHQLGKLAKRFIFCKCWQ